MAKGTGHPVTTAPHLGSEFLTHGMFPKSTPGMSQLVPALPRTECPIPEVSSCKASPWCCRLLRSPEAGLSHPKNAVLGYWRFARLNKSQV